MFNTSKPKDKTEKYLQDRLKWYEDTAKKIPHLKRLVKNNDAGWFYFVDILKKRMEHLKAIKIKTPLYLLDDVKKREIELGDHEASVLQTVINTVDNYTKTFEKVGEQIKKSEDEKSA